MVKRTSTVRRMRKTYQMVILEMRMGDRPANSAFRGEEMRRHIR
jgi:hypothetical protein